MSAVSRRGVLQAVVAAGGAAAGCTPNGGTASEPAATGQATRRSAPAGVVGRKAVQKVAPLNPAGQWKTRDPFLFCAHHDDAYPRANAAMGPESSLAGRRLGSDFSRRDGWSMYHGRVVPGFPAHPHRGFETVTVVRKGRLDHADSLGAAARYGDGDVQWLTAGHGIQHAEMFPLLQRGADNPVELFQIWLNLPRRSKHVAPRFSMLWAPTIPARTTRDDGGKAATLTLHAGRLGGLTAPAPPPDSWAADPDHEVLIATVKLEPGARFTLPAAPAGLHRTLYFFQGQQLLVEGAAVPVGHRIEVASDLPLPLENGAAAAEVLVLQGKPIDEPVARHGPFVMNTREEIARAYNDYQRTRFGGWPWDSSDPVHGRDPQRFARHIDGRVERPG